MTRAGTMLRGLAGRGAWQRPRPAGRLGLLLGVLGMAVGLLLGGCGDDASGNQNVNVPFCTPPAPPEEALRRLGPYDGPGAGPHDRVLPGNRLMTPVGEQVVLGGFPVDVRAHPRLPIAYVTNVGYRLRAVQVVDLDAAEVVQEIPRAEAFYGMAMTADASLLYLAGGASGRVDRYAVGPGGLLSEDGSIPVDGFPAGMAVSEDGSTLYVAQFGNRALAEVDLASETVTAELDLPGAYGVALVPQAGEAGQVWVTAFNGNKVLVVDLGRWEVAAEIPVGPNPLSVVPSPDGASVYVTVTDADQVIRIDTATYAVDATQMVGEASIHDEDGNPLPASSPTGLALDPASGRLFVTRAADNAVGIFDAATLAPLGAVPTAWYPTAVAVAAGGDRIVVANGKGIGTGPNDLSVGGKEKMTGTASVVDLSAGDLPAWTAQVEANVRRPDAVWSWTCEGQFPVPTTAGGPTPIEHVVLIVKENKTYDALFSDLEEGERDPSLLLWGEEVTPNLHALARQFAHHDNFYDDSESSVQGHLWLTASFVNDYMERIWLEDYRGNGFSQETITPQGQPDFGTFFIHLLRHGVGFTNYGEVVGTTGVCCGDSVMDHTDLEYPGVFFNLDVRDEEKARYVVERIQDGVLEPFTFLLLPNDHTKGTASGALTPASMIADNDYAVGLVVEAISHSPFWEKTAIFIVQDDPQSSADHVDYHRSICLVVSPWVRHGYVSSVHTSFPSLFRTFELILGLPPMNRYDALATPLWDVFAPVPDPTPYTALPRRIPEALNAPGAPGQAYSDRMDFRGPDRNPELGDVLWWAVKGAPPPGSRIARELAGEIPSRLDADGGTGVAQRAEDSEEADPAAEGAEDPAEEAAERRAWDRYDAAWRHFERWRRAHPEVPVDLRPRSGGPRRVLPQRW